jgi:hypothetical protein
MHHVSPSGIILVRKGASKGVAVSSSNLIRWGGLAALLAGVLSLIADLLGLLQIGRAIEWVTTGTYAIESLLRMIVLVLLLPLGLVGLYARQSEAAGPLGLLGFVVAFAGTVLVAGFAWTNTFVAPVLATSAPQLFNAGPPPGRSLSFLIFAIGWLLFGAASLLARVYPPRAVISLIVGAVLAALAIFLVPFAGVVFNVAVAWLGFVLFTGGDVPASEQPSRVS